MQVGGHLGEFLRQQASGCPRREDPVASDPYWTTASDTYRIDHLISELSDLLIKEAVRTKDQASTWSVVTFPC